MNPFIQLFSVGLGVFLAGCAGIAHASDNAVGRLASYSAKLREKFPEVAVISTTDLAAMNPQPALLDVRSSEEFEVSRIAGAVRAEDDPVAQLQRLGIRSDQPIVVYCSVGYRSAKAAEKLAKAGFTNVRNLNGSLFAWANENRPLVNDAGPTKTAHPYNRWWGRYLEKDKWER